ncbi:MAG: DNA topoisomerase I [Candidatus Marsarchaeota archaeon]|jgi:DNA topoisomerase-1|nr:DNA topoisomerase I [Candidatus Marsarchaeota archaeon]
MDTLIIAEKPSVALRIAIALGNGEQKRIATGKTSYYKIEKDDSTLYIAPAVGHLFTIRQVGNKRGYPVLDVEWAPSHEASKSSAFTKQYLNTIQEVAKKCSYFINACDYDIEGTVIGTNIIKEVTKQPVEKLRAYAKRMKYSTTTTKDLVDSYNNMSELDLENYYAGEARHMLDWIWGINLSRALTQALGGAGGGKWLSIGRVQGPTLAILARKEKEIASFKPEPFWRITAIIDGTEFTDTRGDMKDKATAEKAYDESVRNKEKATIKAIAAKEEPRWPYPPFDLTSLQLEASRVFRLDPSLTLAIAQKLYERSYISYPRTSSQKLPYSLGLPSIIKALGENPDYAEISKSLAEANRFKPLEGKKSDEAHPAIFPTGVMPKEMSKQESDIYDLIARRFLSCFAEPASVARVKINATIGAEEFYASGAKVTKRAWLDYYRYASIEEREVADFKEGNVYNAEPVTMQSLETKPPKRYSKASIIAELERKGLGTKATRASIVDTLFKRNYVEGSSIAVTSFGMSVYNSLEKNCPMIVDEKTTKELEDDMEGISERKKSEAEVLEHGKKMLLDALEMFNKNMQQVSNEMRSSFMQASILGKCPRCGDGDLIIRHSKIGKQFVACTNYPKCTNTYPLVQKAKIVTTGNICEYCHTPIVKVIRKGMRPFEMDLDPKCPNRPITFRSKEDSGAADSQEKTAPEEPKAQKKTQTKTPKEKTVKKSVKRTKKAAAKKAPKKSKAKTTSDSDEN